MTYINLSKGSESVVDAVWSIQDLWQIPRSLVYKVSNGDETIVWTKDKDTECAILAILKSMGTSHETADSLQEDKLENSEPKLRGSGGITK